MPLRKGLKKAALLILAAFFLGVAAFIILISNMESNKEPINNPSADNEAEKSLTNNNLNDENEKIVICLDPGHTVGIGRGNTEHFGQTESMIVWEIALMLEEGLIERGFEVHKTRGDLFKEVSIEKRAELANSIDADLFLSLHTDLGGFSGYAFYVPDEPGVYKKKAGPGESVRIKSRKIAEKLDEKIKQVGPLQSLGVRSEEITYYGNKHGGSLPISILSEVPVITLELGFLDNEVDGPFLASDEGKQLWVDKLLEAMDSYFLKVVDARRVGVCLEQQTGKAEEQIK